MTGSQKAFTMRNMNSARRRPPAATVVVGCRLTPRDVKALKRLAVSDGRTLSNYLARLIVERVKETT